MKELIAFIISILVWLASLFGSALQPNPRGYPGPESAPAYDYTAPKPPPEPTAWYTHQ